jgi:hypothetical protein
MRHGPGQKKAAGMLIVGDLRQVEVGPVGYGAGGIPPRDVF